MKKIDEMLVRISAIATVVSAIFTIFQGGQLPYIIVNCIFAGILIIVLIVYGIEKKKKPEVQLRKKYNTYLKSEPEYLKEITDIEADSLKKRTELAIKEAGMNRNFDDKVYYLLLFTLFYTAKKEIWSVSIMDDAEWINTKEENAYLKVNLNVNRQGVHLKRIFVVSKTNVAQKLNIFQIKQFIEKRSQYIHLFIVFKENLEEALLHDIGSGFIAFDDFTVACDVFWNNEIRGCLLFNEADIKRYKSIFMEMDNHLIRLDENEWEKWCGSSIKD